MGEMTEWQRQDEQERYSMSWQVANRLSFAFMDGYLTAPEFEHVLYEMGILEDWRRNEQPRKLA